MAIAIGTIVLWDGGTIPTGWQICDGTNGTPNCIDKFAWACETAGILGDTGGSVASHTHNLSVGNTGTRANHDHTGISGASGAPSEYFLTVASGYYVSTNTHTHTVTVTPVAGGTHSHTATGTGSASNLPVHVKLIFIMKIS